jgi:histidine triad (HIT) family protein
VPRIEVDHFADVPEPYYSAIHAAAKLLAPAIQQATGCTRVCTQFVGYEVPHTHYHLIPTESIDDIYVHSPPRADDIVLQDMQAKIISYLA